MEDKRKNRNRTVDPAALEVLANTEGSGLESAYDRYINMQPQCNFGSTGICCNVCIQGPCRITRKSSKGICGANAYTIVARNLVRHALGGCAAHADHGLHATMLAKEVSEGHAPDYTITDTKKLYQLAERIGVSTDGKDDKMILNELVQIALGDITNVEGEVRWLEKVIVPERMEKFRDCNILPKSIHHTIAEAMAQTHIGMDADPVNLVFKALEVSLADYTGEHIATSFSDILFGTPSPVVSEANMGVLDAEYVNLAVHGHNPILSEMIVRAAREMKGEAEAAGAKGIKCVGICCTGNEILMRQGVPILTNFASQELAIMTGAVDAMVVDIQCIMPGIQAVSECFHTRIVTTIPTVKIPGSYYIDFDDSRAMEKAREVVQIAIDAYKERKPEKVSIPQFKNKVVAGFSVEALMDIFAAVNPEKPIKVLTDAILSGELKGVCLLAGCNNLKVMHDQSHSCIARELAKNDVLLVATGCAAQAYAKFGMLKGDAVEKYAGDGLKAFMNRLNEANKDKLTEKLPLVFHMGSCVDNSRAYDLMTLMAEEMQMDTPKVPYVASAPEAMSEKAIAIGSWCVSLGMPTHVGVIPPIPGSSLVDGIALQIAQDVYGGYFIWEEDPQVAVEKLLAAIEERAWKLRVHRMAQEKYETDSISATW